MTWVDRAGNALGSIGPPGVYRNPELSPDGTRVAVDVYDPQNAYLDIWLVDVARGVASRFTFDPGNDVYPVWSPDGSRIVFGSDCEGGVPHLYQKRQMVWGSRNRSSNRARTCCRTVGRQMGACLPTEPS